MVFQVICPSRGHRIAAIAVFREGGFYYRGMRGQMVVFCDPWIEGRVIQSNGSR
jgi:hypothetical protein